MQNKSKAALGLALFFAVAGASSGDEAQALASQPGAMVPGSIGVLGQSRGQLLLVAESDQSTSADSSAADTSTNDASGSKNPDQATQRDVTAAQSGAKGSGSVAPKQSFWHRLGHSFGHLFHRKKPEAKATHATAATAGQGGAQTTSKSAPAGQTQSGTQQSTSVSTNNETSQAGNGSSVSPASTATAATGQVTSSTAQSTTKPVKESFWHRLFHGSKSKANAPGEKSTVNSTAAETTASGATGAGTATQKGASSTAETASKPVKESFWHKLFYGSKPNPNASGGNTTAATTGAGTSATGVTAAGTATTKAATTKAATSTESVGGSGTASVSAAGAAGTTAANGGQAATSAAGSVEKPVKQSLWHRLGHLFHRKKTATQSSTESGAVAGSPGQQTGSESASVSANQQSAAEESASVNQSGGEASKRHGGFLDTILRLWPGGKKKQVPPDAVESLIKDENLSGFLDNAATRHTESMLGSSLSLKDYLQLVAAKNDKIAYQRLELNIAKSDLRQAHGMFETALTANYKWVDNNTPNTTEQQFRLAFAPDFIEKNSDYELAVEKKVPTGGKVKVSYSFLHLDNNIQPAPIKGKENKSYLGISVTQPLLKGGGGTAVVKSPIELANKDKSIALQTYRQSMFQTVSDAAMAYWDLYLADKKVEIRQKSVGIAESVLKDEQERSKFGQGAATDVMSAQSALAQRKVQLYEAQQEQMQARNKLRSFIVGLPGNYNINVNASRVLGSSASVPSRTMAIAIAYKDRPEYIASTLRAQKADVKIKYAMHNSLPELDLVASYGLNGLDKSYATSWRNAFASKHKSAYIGLEYKMYLHGDQKAKGELRVAQLRKRQALLEIRAAEHSIQNSIDTAISNLDTAEKQVHELDSIIATNKKLLNIEMQRFKSGHANSRDLLDLEQRFDETMETYIQSKTNLQKAVVGVQLAEGTLLKRYGLEE